MIRYDKTLKVYYSTKINDADVFSGFGTSDLGDGRDIENIKNFLKKTSKPYRQIVIPEQTHSANISVILNDVKNPSRMRVERRQAARSFVNTQDDKVLNILNMDGLISQEAGCVLTIRTADCAPIVYSDKKTGLYGISHQGWRGTFARLQSQMVKNFIDSGVNLENLTCAIGPAIGECCYEVGDDLYKQFFAEFSQYSKRVFNKRNGKWHLNLLLLNYLLLVDSGVNAKNIDFFPFCTKCNEEKFISARRMEKGDFPRQFNFIVKNDRITPRGQAV